LRCRLTAIPRTLALVLFTAMGLCATLGLSGCGAGGFFGHTATTGSYTITVTATSADLVRTSTVQLTIQ
jgi:ABC-type transporter Mla subunit MlaD